MVLEKSIATLNSGLARVSAVRLGGLGPRDPPKQWLETMGDKAHCRIQWSSCIPNLSPSV